MIALWQALAASKLSGRFLMYRFIVLVPHQNARAAFNGCRRRLFSSGYKEAYSFPAVAPVALVRAPALKPELKALAEAFRQQNYRHGGTISTRKTSSIQLPDGKFIFGYSLSATLPPMPQSIDVIESFQSLVLGAGILTEQRLPQESCEAIEFSAAAFANMTLSALPDECSYSWTIGEPQWLPSAKRCTDCRGDSN
jgi:hypothetical protein